MKQQKTTKRQNVIKSEDDIKSEPSDSDKEEAEGSSTPATPKSKRKVQGRKTNKILAMQSKTVSDSESDTGKISINVVLLFISEVSIISSNKR